MLTRQEIFTKVYVGLMKQKVASVSDSKKPSCVYRGRNGTKCAVGHLIPDSSYSPRIEGKLVDGLPTSVFAAMGIDTQDVEFLQRLQVLHDNYMPFPDVEEGSLDVWMNRMLLAAKEFELTVPEIPEEPCPS